MFGAVLGDYLGSIYEGGSSARRDVPLIGFGVCVTDDSVHTCAVAQALLDNTDIAQSIRSWTLRYPGRGYGSGLIDWAHDPPRGAYNSFGNGSLMRVSSAVSLSRSLEQARETARRVTAVTHNHEVSFAAVDAYVTALWGAIQGSTVATVVACLERDGYLRHDVDRHHQEGGFSVWADETLSDVVSCLANSDNFESCMRECFYHGGDTDTICAIAGPIAEALWGIDPDLASAAMPGVPEELLRVLERAYATMRLLHPLLFVP